MGGGTSDLLHEDANKPAAHRLTIVMGAVVSKDATNFRDLPGVRLKFGETGEAAQLILPVIVMAGPRATAAVRKGVAGVLAGQEEKKRAQRRLVGEIGRKLVLLKQKLEKHLSHFSTFRGAVKEVKESKEEVD